MRQIINFCLHAVSFCPACTSNSDQLQIVADGVNGEGAVQEDHFQQDEDSYPQDDFDQQGGGGGGFDKWDDEEEDWEAQQCQQEQDGKLAEQSRERS